MFSVFFISVIFLDTTADKEELLLMKYLHTYSFAETTPFLLSCGKTLSNVNVAYETWGTLNTDKTNAILIFHAFTGSSHAARHYEKDTEGWWETYVGSGKAFDTDKYFIICANVLGSCYGSTGPSSLNPKTGKPYALNFPFITIRDMNSAIKNLTDHLQISRFLAVAGGSMGGMLALDWSIAYPNSTKSAIVLAASHSQPAQAIAFHQVGRQAILQDPSWKKGNYYGSEEIPRLGLSLARMIGHITYLSEKKMHEKFGRKLQDKAELSFGFDYEFQVESYLRYQGHKFVDRFDANSYLYLTRAIDYFDIRIDHGEGSLFSAFEKSKCDYLMLSYSTDWLYPPENMKQMANTLRGCGRRVVYLDIDTDNGHDSFLIDNQVMVAAVKNFLSQEIDTTENNV